ncbi:tRNA(m5U54)methyltransferase [Blyttiomyces sp. JEL0837]|nr:tRNA(m5U54)methyltransferase [Blyttiomyces sp. JEL0837]
MLYLPKLIEASAERREKADLGLDNLPSASLFSETETKYSEKIVSSVNKMETSEKEKRFSHINLRGAIVKFKKSWWRWSKWSMCGVTLFQQEGNKWIVFELEEQSIACLANQNARISSFGGFIKATFDVTGNGSFQCILEFDNVDREPKSLAKILLTTESETSNSKKKKRLVNIMSRSITAVVSTSAGARRCFLVPSTSTSSSSSSWALLSLTSRPSCSHHLSSSSLSGGRLSCYHHQRKGLHQRASGSTSTSSLTPSKPRKLNKKHQREPRFHGKLDFKECLPSNIESILSKYESENPTLPRIKYLHQDETPLPSNEGSEAKQPREYILHREFTDPMRVIAESPDGQGVCIGKDGMLVLVPTTLAGELVKAKIYSMHLRYGIARADLVEVLEKSPKRVEPICQHFAECSGCSFQHVSYADQIEVKRQIVLGRFEDAVKDLNMAIAGESSDGEVSWRDTVKVVPCPIQSGFRTKLSPHHRSFRGGQPITGLGFLQRGRLMEVVDMKRCEITTPAINALFEKTRASVVGSITAHDRRAATYFFRHSLIPPDGGFLGGRGACDVDRRQLSNPQSRTSQFSNNGTGNSTEKLAEFVKKLHAASTNNNDTTNKTPSKPNSSQGQHLASRLGLNPDSQPWPHAWPPEGWKNHAVTNPREIVTDVVNGQVFRSEANSFFQLNSPLLGYLTHHVRQELQKHAVHRGVTTLLDMYCGSGLFALQASPDFDRVVGLEIDQKAVKWAHQNAIDNGISNTKFVVGDVGRVFDVANLFPTERYEVGKQILSNCAVVVDPPESGCGERFLEQLMRANPKVVVYVSCNVRSQIADLKMMADVVKVGVPENFISQDRMKGKGANSTRGGLAPPMELFLGGKRLVTGKGGLLTSDPSHVDTFKLTPKGYTIVSIKAFDLFPHTKRIENVVVLVRDDLL